MGSGCDTALMATDPGVSADPSWMTLPRTGQSPVVSNHRLITVNEASVPNLVPGRGLWEHLILSFSLNNKTYNLFEANLGLDYPLVLKY